MCSPERRNTMASFTNQATLTYNGGLRDTLASTGKAAEAGEQKGAIGESLKALNRKSHVLETDVEHSKSVISEIVTQVPYIGPEPPENPGGSGRTRRIRRCCGNGTAARG